MSEEEVDKHIVGMVLIQQYNLKIGLNLFVDKGEKEVTKELTQLYNMETFIPMYYTKLTKQKIVEALSSLVVLVDKRGCRVKVRGCSYARKQRDKISKEDATSLIVALESIMIMSFIDTHR